MRKPRQYNLVRWNPAHYLTKAMKSKYPFKEDRFYVYFGEIPNMPGHCIVAGHKTGKILSGYHIENFTELKKDET